MLDSCVATKQRNAIVKDVATSYSTSITHITLAAMQHSSINNNNTLKKRALRQQTPTTRHCHHHKLLPLLLVLLVAVVNSASAAPLLHLNGNSDMVQMNPSESSLSNDEDQVGQGEKK